MLQYTCRDRTLIGMQSDLVGAHAMGVRNVLLTTGSPARIGSYADATSVFEVDAIGLHQHGDPVQPGAGHRRAAHRRADAVSRRGRREPVRDRSGRRVAAAGAQGRTRAPSFSSRRRFSTSRRSSRRCARLQDNRVARPGRCSRPSKGFATRNFSRARSWACGSLIRYLERLRGRPMIRTPRRWPLRSRSRRWLRQRVNGLQITSFHGSPLTTEQLLTELGRSAHA